MANHTLNIIDELLSREYGALVLRNYVGRNLIKGAIIASVVAWILIGCYYGYFELKKMFAKEEVVKQVVYIDPTKLALPPSLSEQVVQQLKIAVPNVAPVVAIKPKAVKDEEVPDTVTVMTIQELASKIDEGRVAVASSGTGEGTDIVVAPPIEEEYIPKPDEFIPTEKQPVPIHTPAPEYPEMLRNAGITGTVVVQFLVKKNGDIGEVKVLKATPPNLGFEEAAIKAVKTWKMKPAISNGQPVAIWVTQPIRFKLQ